MKILEKPAPKAIRRCAKRMAACLAARRTLLLVVVERDRDNIRYVVVGKRGKCEIKGSWLEADPRLVVNHGVRTEFPITSRNGNQ